MTLLLDPTGEIAEAHVDPVDRLPSLRGARIGYLENTKHNAAAFMGLVLDRLVEERGAAPGVRARKDYSSAPASEDILDQVAAGCDAVVVGTAD